MRLGYACINQTLGKDGSFKTITVKSASKLAKEELIKKVKGLAVDNLYNTYKILQWNLENNIYMYRLSSDIIPLATHELLSGWEWYNDKDIINICNRIKDLVIKNDIRISMHPDQFNVINTPKDEVFNLTVKSLEYHSMLSKLVGNKTLILHIGGVYGDKNKAIQQFITGFKKLPRNIQDKIILENDDKSYNVEEVLYICNQINIPMCLDLHHDRCLPSSKPIESYIQDIINTWHGNVPKCHLSSGKDFINDKKHADYITKEDYLRALEITQCKFDIMIEAKSKELNIKNI